MNKNTIQHFYDAFANRDIEQMLDCYHDEVIFHDPAFGRLKGKRAHGMWRMLVSRLNEESNISVRNVMLQKNKGSAEWTAEYTYGKKKRPITNHIKANFILKDNKIIEHHDQFNLWKWSSQALGLPGYLLGWTPFIKKSIQKKTNQMLDSYLSLEK